ncbi:MAG: AI-2E family transporter [Acidimicrobiales bacterium]
MDESGNRPEPTRRVHPLLVRLADYGWRLLILAAVAVALLWLLRQLWVLVLAVVIATYLTRVLDLPARWLRTRGVPRALAALLSLLLFFGSIVLIGWVIVPDVADEFRDLGPTLSTAVDDIEEWLVEDAPFGLDRQEIDDIREQAGDSVTNTVGSSSGALVTGALLAVEVFVGILMAIITAFFLLKDGPELQERTLNRFPVRRRDLVRRLGVSLWETIGGYLRGAALLGAIEGVIIAVAATLVGAELVVPIALLTFAAAFVPLIGAVVAGLIAVLVTLATAGFGPALIVAAVAVVVQQLDNELLAPVIYGRSLQLHPLTILFAVVGGGALFGFAGTVLAVPVTAVVINLIVVARADAKEQATGPLVEGSPAG